MSAAAYVHTGKSIDYIPNSAVEAGAVVVQGELVGVATRPVPANTLGALAVSGVFDFPKETGSSTAISAGANVYWDVADGEATTDADTGTNKLLGKTIQAATDGDATVRVRLSQ